MAKPLPIFSAPEEFERLHVRPRPGRTLIVGSYVTEGKPDRRAPYADVVGVDMRPGPGVDIVQDMELVVAPGRLGMFDHVECRSVLEHARRPWRIAETLERVMNPGATLHFSVPFVWRLHAHPSDYWRMTAEGVRDLFLGIIDWKVLVYGDEAGFRGADDKVRAARVDGHLYVARTEVFGFGVKV